MPLIQETFSAEMRAQIARKQLSSGDLANELDLSASQVNRLLRGNSRWSLDQATRAATWAGLDVVSIFSGRESGK